MKKILTIPLLCAFLFTIPVYAVKEPHKSRLLIRASVLHYKLNYLIQTGMFDNLNEIIKIKAITDNLNDVRIAFIEDDVSRETMQSMIDRAQDQLKKFGFNNKTWKNIDTHNRWLLK